MPVNQFSLGFNDDVKKYINWKTFTDSWTLVDGGASALKLPLFVALRRYYAGKPPERLAFEANLLRLKAPDSSLIALEWVTRHIKLYNNIKRRGFTPAKRTKPITVRIKSGGGIHIIDGNHTISILKHLKYDKRVEAIVAERDPEWVKLKERLYNFYGKKLLYQPVNHPDFDDWNVDRECVNRWSTIRSAANLKGKMVLDVGSNTGWFSRCAAAEGAKVVGVEPNAVRVHASKALSGFHGFSEHNPFFVQTSVEDYFRRHGDAYFDVILLLSLLHHYIRRNQDEAWRLVNLLSQHCKNMVLELETGNLPVEWNPNLIIRHSEYKHFKTLSEKDRPIYLFTVRAPSLGTSS